MLNQFRPSTKPRNFVSIFLGASILLLLLSTAHASCNNDNDCLNGGTCINDLGKAHYCLCSSGFIGVNCQESCPLQCQNGGQCDHASDEHAFVNGVTDFVCDCPSEYRGLECEEANTRDTADAPPRTSSPDDGLSGGAIAGIVLGCLAGVALVALVVVKAASGRRRANEAKTPVEGVSTGTVTSSVKNGDEESGAGLPRIN